ncbi:hypothetical protein [Saccharopolyspora shandongensis]
MGTNHPVATLLAEADPLMLSLLAGFDVDTDELQQALLEDVRGHVR